MRIGTIPTALLSVFMMTTDTQAIDFNICIDFGDEAGIAPGNWNIFDAPTGSRELIDLDSGDSTGITATLDGWVVTGSFNPDGWNVGTVGWVMDEAGSDLIAVGNGTATVTLSNVPAGSYTVDLVSAAGTTYPGVRDHDITVNGSFADSDYLGTGGNGDDWDPFSEGVNNWLTYEFVTPSSGNIVISVTGDQNQADLNALRLITVPEPRTYALIIGLISGLFVWMRRRS